MTPRCGKGHFHCKLGCPKGTPRKGNRVPYTGTCPNPTKSMRYEGSTWRRDCDCSMCSKNRTDFVTEATCKIVDWWAGQEYDIDEVAVDMVVAGHRMSLNKGERIQATERLTKKGWTSKQIADLIGCTPRSVVRYRHSELERTS